MRTYSREVATVLPLTADEHVSAMEGDCIITTQLSLNPWLISIPENAESPQRVLGAQPQIDEEELSEHVYYLRVE